MATWTVPLVLSILAPAADVEFNRDVRPILSNRCFRCHGPDTAARKAGLRLDRKHDALATLPSGEAAIVPGDVESSALLWRIAEEDETVRMPPPKSGKSLEPRQVEILRRW